MKEDSPGEKGKGCRKRQYNTKYVNECEANADAETQVNCVYCVVPENTHAPAMGDILVSTVVLPKFHL